MFHRINLSPDGDGVGSGAGNAAAQAQATGASASPKIEFTPEQQAKIEEIKVTERKAWEKSHKETFDKAKAHDELVAKQKEKEQAEMTELDRLKAQVTDLSQYKTRAEEYEASFKSILDAKLAAVPEDKKALIPDGLSNTKLLEWIERNHKILFGTEPIAAAPGSITPTQGRPDPLMKEAMDKVNAYYPKMDVNSDVFKKKVADTYEMLKQRPLSV